MIKLDQPSLAINTFNVPGPEYRMDQTVKLTKYADATVVVHQIQLAITNSPQSYLKNVVINSHGGPGYLYVGETKVKHVDAAGQRHQFPKCLFKPKDRFYKGIGVEDVGLFGLVKGCIGTIWLIGCQVAGESIYRTGRTFCPQLAMTVGCNVLAANVYQSVNRPHLPKNCIDDYEGTAYMWDPSGVRGLYQQGKRI